MLNLKLAFRTLFRTPFVTSVAILSLALGIGGERGHLLAVPPDAAAGAAGAARPADLVNLSAPGPKPGSTLVQPGRRLRRRLQLRDVPRPASAPAAVQRRRGAPPVRRQPRGRRTDVERGRRAGLRQLLPGARAAARARPAAGACRRSRRRRVAGRRPQPRLLADAVRRAPGRARTARSSSTGRRSRSSVSPRAGSTARRSGRGPQVFVPITLRGLMEPGFEGFADRRSYWAYLFARLRPGVSIEQARVGHQRDLPRRSSTTSRRRCSRG